MTDTHPHDAGISSDHRAGSEPSARRSADAHRSPPSAALLDHVVVEHDDAPDACTIYPIDATGATVRSTWLTARGRSFVDLESAR